MTGDTTNTEQGLTDKKAPSPAEVGLQTTVAYQQITPAVSDRYSPLQFHAKGGVGEVWLAEDAEIGRQVALKRLLRNDEGSNDRFLAEAQIAGQLEHPSIVPVHDLGIDKSGLPYYVMKFVHGQTLRDAIEEFHHDFKGNESDRKLRQQRLLNQFIDICEAVAFAHTRGVVHRDLKPSNVMLGLFGETIVLDWGLAKVLHQPEMPGLATARTSSGRSTETAYGSVIGTPSYMAPEIAAGKAAEAGPATDIYLLGATLYEILTGNAPRRGSSRDEILELARTVQPVSPRDIDRQIARPLDAICLKAMSKRESDRYASALELADEVRRYLADEPVAAYPEPWNHRLWRWIKRHRRGLMRGAAVATMLAVSCGAIAAVSVSRKRAEAAERQAAELAMAQQTREEIQLFRQLYDEANFKVGFENADERFKYYDAAAGRQSIDHALRMAEHWGENWGDQLQAMPLTQEREPILRELYELLLRRAQVGMLAASPDDPGQPLRDLEFAAAYNTPTRAFYQLRAASHRLLGKEVAAANDEATAVQDDTRVDAFDHFVRGEQLRLASISRNDPTAVAAEPSQRNLSSAVEEYRAALQKDPDHYWSRLQLGRCYLAGGMLGEAIESLGACIALRPDAPWAYSARAVAPARQRRYTEAMEDLNRVLEADPTFGPARLNRGWVHWQQKETDQAIADLQQVRSDSANQDALADFYLGQIYLDQDNLPLALSHFSNFADATQRDTYWIAHKYLATVHFLLGKETEGREHLDLYLQLRSDDPFDPDAASTRLERGKFLRQLSTGMIQSLKAKAGNGTRRFQELSNVDLNVLAVAESELSAASTSLQTEDLYYELGIVTERIAGLQGSARGIRKAIDHYAAGLEIEPDSMKLLNKRGMNHRALGQKPLALEDFQRATRLKPQSRKDSLLSAEAHSWVGILLTEQGEREEAMRHAARCLAVLFSVDDEPETYGVLHNVACIYGGLSALEAEQRIELQNMAIEVLEQALSRARRAGVEAVERQYIQAEEPQFFGPELRARPEFQALER